MEAPGRGCSIIQDGRGLSRSLQEEGGSADTQPSLAPKAGLLLTFVSSNCTIISFCVCVMCVHTRTPACSHVQMEAEGQHLCCFTHF